MSPEKKEQAIEKACGWEELPEGHFHPDNPIGQTRPDYLGDLNACHEMEKVLTEKGVNAWWAYVAFINRHNPTPFGSETAVHATAPQRCEAFLRTLGLWEKEANTTKSASSTPPATEDSSATPTISHEADFVTKSTQPNQ